MYLWMFPQTFKKATSSKTPKIPLRLDIRDRTVTTALLQRIFRKMDQDTVVKLYMTSKYAQSCVESICQPTFSRYAVARQAEYKLLQMKVCSILFLENSQPDLDDWIHLLDKSQVILRNHEQNLKDLNLAVGSFQLKTDNVFRRIYEDQYKEQKRRVRMLEQVVENYNLLRKEERRSAFLISAG